MSSENLPSQSPDIFSLSDRVLAEKLQFVKEVRLCFNIDRHCLFTSLLRLVLEIGAVFGYADRGCQTVVRILNLP
jgi:hypothetical protein